MFNPQPSHVKLESTQLDDLLHDFKLWEELALAISQATQPQRSDLFFAYFALAEQIASLLPAHQQWQLYRSQLSTLLSTIEDASIPAHWRRMCFESIHRPLLSLGALNQAHSDRSELRDLYLAVNQQLDTAFSSAPF